MIWQEGVIELMMLIFYNLSFWEKFKEIEFYMFEIQGCIWGCSIWFMDLKGLVISFLEWDQLVFDFIWCYLLKD